MVGQAEMGSIADKVSIKAQISIVDIVVFVYIIKITKVFIIVSISHK